MNSAYKTSKNRLVIGLIAFFSLFSSSACLAGSEQDVEADPSKVLKLKWLMEAESDELFQLIDKSKGEPLVGRLGASSTKTWCDVVVRPLVQVSQRSRCFGLVLRQDPANAKRFSIVELTETRVSGAKLERVSYTTPNSPQLVDMVTSWVNAYMLKKCGTIDVRDPIKFRNYSFRLTWDSDDFYSIIEEFVKEPLVIPDGLLAESAWGKAAILPQKTEKDTFHIELLSKDRFRVFKNDPDRKDNGFIYYGEFKYKAIWDAIVSRMVSESPAIRARFSYLFDPPD